MPLTQICNIFINFSHFLKDCKVTKLTPLHKKITKADTGNNPICQSPISLLSIVSKIIEKVIQDQTMNHFTENIFCHQMPI